jgi:hypothetical protein
MAGAFLEPDTDDGYLHMMAVCRGRDTAERFVAGEPGVGELPGWRRAPRSGGWPGTGPAGWWS